MSFGGGGQQKRRRHSAIRLPNSPDARLLSTLARVSEVFPRLLSIFGFECTKRVKLAAEPYCPISEISLLPCANSSMSSAHRPGRLVSRPVWGGRLVCLNLKIA